MVCRSHSDPARRRPKPAIGICQPSEQMSAQHSPDHSAPQSGRIFRDFHWGGIRSAVCKIWKRGVHVRTCRCTPPLTCAKVIASWFINTSNLNAIGPTVMELSMVGCLRHPLTRHVSLAVAGIGVSVSVSVKAGIGVGQIRNTLNGRHQTKKTAYESVNLFQRYKLLKSVTGSGWVGLSWVGSG